MPVLIFTLYGALMGFGAPAVGEQRPCWDRPSRGGIMGLLAAALGIDRADDVGQAALDTGLHLAVRQDAPGVSLIDYHTVQMPVSRARGGDWLTRAEALAAPGQGTLQTWRGYLMDALATIAVARAGEASTIELGRLAEALARPKWALCLGRRACPLGLPPRPEIIEAPDLVRAFEAYAAAAPAPEAFVREHLAPAAALASVAMDADAPSGWRRGYTVVRTDTRRDRASGWRRRRFDLRDELIMAPDREAS